MQDRRRSVAYRLGRLAGAAQQRLRPKDDRVGSQVDDDHAAEALPSLDASDPADPELSRLDDGDAAPLDIADAPLFELLRKIDPTPAVPLVAAHEIGFVALLQKLSKETDRGFLEDRKVRRVLDLVGDRLSISAGPDGVTVRGLLRRRHIPWKHMQRLVFTSRYDLLRGDYFEKLIDSIKSRVMPLPIPGLRWLLARMVGGLAEWLEKKVFDPDEIEAMKHGAGLALTQVQRRGADLELSGALLLVSILGPGLSEATEQEARRRGIPVVVVAQE